MSAWLRGNWKYLLAAVGVFAVVIVLYLRSRSSGGAASQISFPAPAAGADTGAGAAPAAPLATGTPGTYLAGTSGLTTWQGNTYRWFVTAPNQGIQDAAAFFAQQRDTSGQLSDELGRLTFFNGNATSDAAGNTFWTLPLGLPGYKEGDLPKWQRLIYAGGIPAGAGVGVGGPGAIANLSAAGLRAQAASHRAALRDTRLSRRLAHDARQAAGESRRLALESRGAAPVNGPGALLSGRQRWRR